MLLIASFQDFLHFQFLNQESLGSLHHLVRCLSASSTPRAITLLVVADFCPRLTLAMTSSALPHPHQFCAQTRDSYA
jgi:hypothetical protein